MIFFCYSFVQKNTRIRRKRHCSRIGNMILAVTQFVLHHLRDIFLSGNNFET